MLKPGLFSLSVMVNLLFFSFSLAAQNLTEELTLKTPSGDIHGTLALPSTGGQAPVVLIIAGSGPTDRNGNSPGGVKASSYKMLADSLRQHGIASLRYDKRGIGESATAMKSESDLRFDDMIGDAVGFIKMLKADHRFSSVTVLGHSEGSLIGMVAARLGGADGYISASGAGDRADRIIEKQLRGQSPPLAEKAKTLLDSLVEGHTVQPPGGPLDALFRASVQPYIISWLKYDPQKEIARLEIPILIVQGTTDIQVGVDDAEALKKANPKARLLLIPGMNHVWKDAPPDRQANIATYLTDTLSLKPEMVQAIDDFVRTGVKKRPNT